VASIKQQTMLPLQTGRKWLLFVFKTNNASSVVLLFGLFCSNGMLDGDFFNLRTQHLFVLGIPPNWRIIWRDIDLISRKGANLAKLAANMAGLTGWLKAYSSPHY
jgi:hypothetical protein